MDALKRGLTAELTHEVRDEDSAERWANPLPVLATPVLLWLAEVACMRAVEGALPSGAMTVGFAHDVKHLAPTPVGDRVTVRATLQEVDGPKLRFAVEAVDGTETVLAGTHRRVVVAPEPFMQRVRAKGPAVAAMS